MAAATQTPWWAWTWPALAWAVLLVASFLGGGGLVIALAGVVLIATVFAAVHHAEVIAHRVGEPFGTLVLALAVTVIETALIVSVMISAPADSAALARDTVFAAVMIVCNGIVGLCLLLGGARHHEQGFQLQGASAALAVLVALISLALILPSYVAPELGPVYSPTQLVFAGLVALVLYGSFVFVQTGRHRDYFLPVEADDEEAHAPPPSRQAAILSAGPASRLACCHCGACEAPHAHRGAGCRPAQRPEGRGGRHHRHAGADAGSTRGRQGGAEQSIADQLEPRAGFGARDHRPDDPGRRRGFDRAGPAAGAGPRRKRSGHAGA